MPLPTGNDIRFHCRKYEVLEVQIQGQIQVGKHPSLPANQKCVNRAAPEKLQKSSTSVEDRNMAFADVDRRYGKVENRVE